MSSSPIKECHGFSVLTAIPLQTKINGFEGDALQELGVPGGCQHWFLSHGLDVCTHGSLAGLLHSYGSHGWGKLRATTRLEGAGEKLLHPLVTAQRGRILRRGLPIAKEPRVLDHQ